jgi:alpha-tubulin suppressor-like RCC1 family protein
VRPREELCRRPRGARSLTPHPPRRGGNENLQTGATETPSQAVPLPLRILPHVRVRCVAAGSMHSIALTDTGHVWAWGQPLTSWGQPDSSNCYVRQRGPVRVEGVDNVVQIAAGAFHNLALTASGHVFAWGNSDYGQLGLGSTTHVSSPHLIPELSRAGVISLAAGGWHSGVITAGGVVYVWGRGEHGRLGLGDDTRDRLRPVELQLRARVQHLSMGGTHSVVVTEHGDLLSCGRPSFGRLGRGPHTNPNVLQPVELPVAPQGCRWLCETASAGGRHTLAACRSVVVEEGEEEAPILHIHWPGTPPTALPGLDLSMP